jgi:hypothetical protein
MLHGTVPRNAEPPKRQSLAELLRMDEDIDFGDEDIPTLGLGLQVVEF